MFKLVFFDGRESVLFVAWWDGARALADHFPAGSELDDAGRISDADGLWVASYFDEESGPPSALLPGDDCVDDAQTLLTLR